jgi:hypothetical protein
MRSAIFLAVILFAAQRSAAGPIEAQFGSGYEGVSWGMSLTKLVGVFPDGEHYFTTAPGERGYMVRNNDPIFGVPRAGTRVQYHLGKDGGVEIIAVGVPYERRDQLNEGQSPPVSALCQARYGHGGRETRRGRANWYAQ